MNHIRTYHYYWHIFFFSLLVCMAEFTKAADRDVLERVIYLAKSKGTVYTLLGKVSEQSGFLFVYDSKVVDNDRMVKLGAGQRTIRQAVYEIIGRQDISLHIVENHILINQLQVQCPVVTTSKDTLAYFTLEGKLQDNQSGAPIAYGTVGVVGYFYRQYYQSGWRIPFTIARFVKTGLHRGFSCGVCGTGDGYVFIRGSTRGVVSGTSGDSYSRSGDSCCQSYTVVA